MTKKQKLEFALQLLHTMLGNDAEKITALFEKQKNVFGDATSAIQDEAIELLPVGIAYGDTSQEKEKLTQHQAFRDKVLALADISDPGEVRIEGNFSLPAEQQIPVLQTCIDRINQLVREKNNLDAHTQTFYVKVENGFVKIGYENNPCARMKGFHNHISLEYDTETNIAAFGFLIFDGCKEWNLYEHIRMYGAPEEGRDAGFTIPLSDMTYSYITYTKR